MYLMEAKGWTEWMKTQGKMYARLEEPFSKSKYIEIVSKALQTSRDSSTVSTELERARCKALFILSPVCLEGLMLT